MVKKERGNAMVFESFLAGKVVVFLIPAKNG